MARPSDFPLVLDAVAEALTAISGEWQVRDGAVQGPGTTAVRAENRHGDSAKHVDLGFVLNVHRDDVPVVWDCCAGFDEEPGAALRQGVRIWAQTTAPVVLELLDGGRGKLADHAHGADGLGLAGWHSIHGALMAFGREDAPGKLQRWALDSPIIPLIGRALIVALPRTPLHGAKFFFGGHGDNEVAEVRIDGVAHEDCSAALAKVPWPRVPAYVRAFVLFVHPEGDT